MAITGCTPSNESVKVKIHLEFFAVRNKEGKFFRSVGYGGGGKSWVDEIGDAKIYAKIGGARGRVTWFASHYPEYGIPEIIKIIANEVEVIDETQRVNKSIERKKNAEIQREKWYAEQKIQDAEEELAKAKEKLKKLKNEISKGN